MVFSKQYEVSGILKVMLKYLALAVGVTLLTTPFTVFAQAVPGYLTDKGDAAVRVELAGIAAELPPQTFWQKLQSLIGLRRTQPYQPEVGTTFTVQSSAYAPSPYQTDATPCTTAVGTPVRPGVVASNFLPIGTVLDINGEKFIVEDRMNPRYDGYFLDIWFPSTSQALEFGRKQLTITVIGYDDPGTAIREEVPDTSMDEDDVAIKQIPPEEPSFLERVQLTFTGLVKLIGAKVSPDVNRYDVDCLREEGE